MEKEIEILNNGGVGIIPTDTLYGIVGRALDKDVVLRIKKLKRRSEGKPFIILISKIEDLDILNIDLDDRSKDFLLKVWPGSVSVVLKCDDENLRYLHDGMNLAIRWPKNDLIESVIQVTGPLVAPSANPEGMKPASNINEAREYFGNSVDFYLDGGALDREPSTLVSIKDGEIKILRQGSIKIE